MKKNGTTSKGTTRWRCTTCKASLTRATQWSAVQPATFRMFIDWATSKKPLTKLAADTGTSISTL